MEDLNPPTDATRRELQDRVDRVIDAPLGAARAEAMGLVARIQQLPPPRRGPGITLAFERIFARLYDESGPFEREGAAPPEQLASWLEAIEILRDELLPLSDENAPDALDEVRREARWLLEHWPPEQSAPPLARTLLDDIDKLTLDRTEEMGSGPRSSLRPGRPLQIIGEHLTEYLAKGRKTFVGTLDAHRRQIWRGIFAEFRMREGDSRRRYLQRLADDIQDRGEDALARVEDVPRFVGDRLLSNALTDVRRTRMLLRRGGLDERRRELRRLSSRILAQRADRRVRARQKAQVGGTALRWFDRVMLATILTVVVVLVMRFITGRDEAFSWLRWVDAVACLLLLGEFLWRFQASRWSPVYFLRHLGTDVIPSLLFLAVLQRGDPSGQSVGLLLTLRLARPVIELYRIIAFTSRGVDRLVQENRNLLNRNIVLFEPVPDQEEAGRHHGPELERLHARLARRLRLELRSMGIDPEDGNVTQIVIARIDGLHARLAASKGGDRSERVGQDSGRDIRIEVLIEGLLTLEPDVVEDYFGRESADRIARFLGFLDIPLVRRLPVVRRIVPGIRTVDPLDGLARAGRGLGRALDEAMDRVRLYDDLRGIVTGPQLVDRVGSAVVKATQRPAVRLLMFAIATLIVGWVVGLVPALAQVHSFLSSVLRAMVWLGSICLVFWGLGQWLRRIADEATELWQRVAEAQGINLLKLEKRRHQSSDREALWQRALGVEAERMAPNAHGILDAWIAGRVDDTDALLRPYPELAGLSEQTDFLYEDYLDGGVLHRSNVKSTEQALGNLELRAIREQRLKTGRKSRKRLEKLALDRQSALPTGPSLWFRFITESLAQGAARLILAYDEHLVPKAHRHRVHPAALDLQAKWMAAEGFGTGRRERERLLAELGSGCARFHALHFLAHSDERDARVAAEYGKDVLERLQRDRRALFRRVFSTRGWEHLAASQRMGNPLVLYGRYLEGGRFLILPLRVLWGGIRLVAKGVGRLTGIVRELLASDGHPSPESEDLFITEEGVIRKINRMHRPIFMEMLDLRAQFDPEYLGLDLPGAPECPPHFGSIQEDLAFVGSRAYEREHYRELRRDRELGLLNLRRWLEARGWPAQGLRQTLSNGTESNASPTEDSSYEREAMRAICLAFFCDDCEVRSLLEAPLKIEDAMRRVLAEAEPDSPLRRFLWSPTLRRHFRLALDAAGLSGAARSRKRILRGAFVRNQQALRTLAKVIDRAGGLGAAEHQVRQILDKTAAYPAPWTHQLLTLRLVQTMTRLDTAHTRDHVLSMVELDRDEA